MKMKKPRWRRINSPRNSVCGSARLDSLDWSNWWSDGWGPNVTHIHVARPEDETYHRVYCRQSANVRVGMKRGELCWIIDKEQP